MNLLGKVFKKKKEVKTYPQDGEFKLCIINDKTDIMHETLGITNERAEELAKSTLECFEKHDKVTDMLNEAFSYCKHLNEVTMVVFMHHRIVQVKKMGSMESLLKNMFE